MLGMTKTRKQAPHQLNLLQKINGLKQVLFLTSAIAICIFMSTESGQAQRPGLIIKNGTTNELQILRQNYLFLCWACGDERISPNETIEVGNGWFSHRQAVVVRDPETMLEIEVRPFDLGSIVKYWTTQGRGYTALVGTVSRFTEPGSSIEKPMITVELKSHSEAVEESRLCGVREQLEFDSRRCRFKSATHLTVNNPMRF